VVDLPSRTSHVVETGTGESGSIVVSGGAVLDEAGSADGPMGHGQVVQNAAHGRYRLGTNETAARLLTYHGGPTSWQTPTAEATSVVGGRSVVRRFAYTDADDNPFHMPDLGFLHMSARWLIDEANGASSGYTLGQSTFAPGDGSHELHRHPDAEEVFFVWEGEGVHLTPDGEFPMTAGQLVFVSKNEWHGFRNTGRTPLKAIFGFLGANSLDAGGYEVYHPNH